MYILGMESSCDETSCAILEMDEEKGIRRIMSNIVASQIEMHALYGGVVPEIASRAHVEAVSGITYRALEEAKLSLSQIDAVTVTANPGLIGALLVGVNFAKSLAYANHIPLVPVNHVAGHIAAAYLSDTALKPPFLALVVSGGHTALYRVTDFTHMTVVGTTRDDAAGEAFDKIARVMGMPYPGGAAMDKLAREGNPKSMKFPSPALPNTHDFSFSGLKTAALNTIHTFEQRGETVPRADLAASYTDTVVKGLVKHTGTVLDELHLDTLVLAGGVAANSHLREGLNTMCQKKKVKFVVPPISLCGDNAAMIAASGYYRFMAGVRADTSLNASALDD